MTSFVIEFCDRKSISLQFHFINADNNLGWWHCHRDAHVCDITFAIVLIISVMRLQCITLHYITLRHFNRPITPTVTNGASTKSFKFSECELKKSEFSKVTFEGISVCEFLEIGLRREFHAFGPENVRNSARRTLVLISGSSYRKLLEDLSLSWPGRSATDGHHVGQVRRACDQLATRCMSTQSL